MAPIITPEAHRLGVAHILKNHINDYQDKYQLWSQHRKVVYDLLNCRTAYLGGHIDRCDHCRSDAHRLPFMPQSPLPHMPAYAA